MRKCCWKVLEMAVILLLLISAPVLMAEDLVEIRASNTTSTLEGDSCVCRVFTGWSELEEYNNLNEMRTRLGNAENLVHFMNFTAIFEHFNNFTDRLNNLEKHINEQAVATSVTELFALRKKIDNVLSLVEQTSSSNFVLERKTRLEEEFRTISESVDEMWSRNPYKQREDFKREVEELRQRYSKCNVKADVTIFKGDALPLILPPSEGWCPKEMTPLRVGIPTTHKWEHGSSYDSSGMWFKDPSPLTNASKATFWEIKRNNNYNRRQNIYKYSAYSSLLNDRPSSSHSRSEQLSIIGYGAIVYKNKLFYNQERYLKKMDLSTKTSSYVSVGFQSVGYKGSGSTTYLDLKVDELGLWLIYSMSSDNKIAISKIDPETLIITKTWMTGVVKTDICGAFMVCGQMYTVRSCSTRAAPTTPNYVYDTRTSLGKYLQFHVPSKYGSISQLTYNSRERLLFGWDNGHLVTYNMDWELD